MTNDTAVEVRVGDLAHARSGDKGNRANVGVVAHDAACYAWLETHLTAAVVAEFVAGTGGAETGLAFRILEAGYRLAIPRLFAALFLLSLTGIVIYLVLDALSRILLRHWHESAFEEEEE